MTLEAPKSSHGQVLKTNDRQEARRKERSADGRQVPDSGLQQAEVPCHTAKQRDLGLS